MVNNLNDGLAWGLFPLYFAAAGLSVADRGLAGPIRGVGASASSSPAPCPIGSAASG